METRSITSTELAAFIGHLRTVERSAGTIEKYFRDTGRVAACLGGAEGPPARTASWRGGPLGWGSVEAAQAGRAEISLKGKLRTILLPGKLCRKLKKYARAQKTASGEIFLTRSGKSLSRRQIWSEMKRLCNAAGVAPSKVFPHNLRHLFARTFYRVCRDVVKLADVLGHSSIETTRIYLISTGAEHAEILRKMRLIQ